MRYIGVSSHVMLSRKRELRGPAPQRSSHDLILSFKQESRALETWIIPHIRLISDSPAGQQGIFAVKGRSHTRNGTESRNSKAPYLPQIASKSIRTRMHSSFAHIQSAQRHVDPREGPWRKLKKILQDRFELPTIAMPTNNHISTMLYH
jgi:hypothetical protein